MKNVLKKSSFTLPRAEAETVRALKKKLKVRSNTQVIRLALAELSSRLDRNKLRESFSRASQLVNAANQDEMAALDDLAGENL